MTGRTLPLEGHSCPDEIKGYFPVDCATLKTIMFRRLSVAFALTLLAGFRLFAQQAPLSLCLVQIKPSLWNQYDPPAGPWAAEVYDMLSTRKLTNGVPLQITVLPAEIEKDVPRAVSGLRCPYVVELGYHGSLWKGGRSVGEDSVLFTLRSGLTRKAIANGASLIPGTRNASKAMFTEACADLTQQIVKSLNKLP
jgi:hypothetical protein